MGKVYLHLPYFREEDRPDWHRKVYAGSDGTTSAKRRYPGKAIRTAILTKQDHCCLYCGHRFGSVVQRNGRSFFVTVEWDHAAPFVYLQANPSDNWVAACRACNQIKHARMFDSLVAAQEYIRERRREKGYEDEPLRS